MTATLFAQNDTQVVLPVQTGRRTRKSAQAVETVSIATDAPKFLYTLSETGVVWLKGFTQNDVINARSEVNSSSRRISFQQADIIKELVDTFKLELAAVAKTLVTSNGSEMSVMYAKSLLSMARAIPAANRRSDVSVTAHVECKALKPDEQKATLAVIAKDNLSVLGIRNYIKGKYGKKENGSNGHVEQTRKPRTPVANDAPLAGIGIENAVQTDTRGNVTAQPIQETATTERTDRFMIVPEDLAAQIREMATSGGVPLDMMLRSMLASAISREKMTHQAEKALQARETARVVNNPTEAATPANTPDVATLPTMPEMPVETTETEQSAVPTVVPSSGPRPLTKARIAKIVSVLKVNIDAPLSALAQAAFGEGFTTEEFLLVSGWMKARIAEADAEATRIANLETAQATGRMGFIELGG